MFQMNLVVWALDLIYATCKGNHVAFDNVKFVLHIGTDFFFH